MASDKVVEDNSAAIETALSNTGDIYTLLNTIYLATANIMAAVRNGGDLWNENNAIKTAVELLDNAISGARMLTTEDNSADIKTAVEAIQTAVELLDNAISGSKMLVTEDNSADIKTAVEAIQTAVEILDNAISGTSMRTQITTLSDREASVSAIDLTSADYDVTHNSAGWANIGMVWDATGGVNIEVYYSNDSSNWIQDLTNTISSAASGFDIRNCPFSYIRFRFKSAAVTLNYCQVNATLG